MASMKGNEMIRESVRLPCRGCVKTCKRYTSCNGRPWRLQKKDPIQLVSKKSMSIKA